MTHAHAAPARSTKNATAHNFMKPLEAKIHKYLKDRNWHNLRPVDVAKSIMIEGAELLELFQWENRTLEEVKQGSKEHKAEIRKELADVLLYAIELSVLMGFDTPSLCASTHYPFLVQCWLRFYASSLRGISFVLVQDGEIL